ncbi:thiamine diphosphokinase [Pseudobutyrivibrio ruminis]|uniref:Thiamine diphosphokinase n=1 Tax=Pseudobutyrivibrio ruminis DSM 9787 TaxID=1123011 RepID=A0A285RRI3_9FIRM|nr:thiamine diphosphokinase [Pseudobutyrivibrio ruminis]SOB96763.1 thiamine pyrophosphokinase [Pseudobutyrivibrio ruminis DSM 9787]
MIVIIGGGSINTSFAKEFIDRLDKSSLSIMACDSGYENCLAIGLEPDIVIGDFDSISREAYEKLQRSNAEVIKLNPVKDDTDIEAAVNIAIHKTSFGEFIYILGGTGKRLDHFLGNVNLLGLGCLKQRKVVIVDEYNYIQMISAGQTLSLSREGEEAQFGHYVSVFPYGGKATGVTMTGFKYPLENATIEGFNTLTVSNELIESSGSITLKEGYLIVCETRDAI